MPFFPRESIRRKLVLAILVIALPALILAVASLLAYEIRESKVSARRELAVLGEVLGENATAALDFKDVRDANRLLATLGVHQRIQEAALYDQEGRPFATYLRHPSGQSVPPMPPDTPSGIDGNRLWLSQRIRRGERVVGTLYLQSDLTNIQTKLRWTLGMGLLFLVSVGGVAMMVAARFGRILTEPILHLAETARLVAEQPHVQERVARESEDEVGQLVDAFNTMLDRLRERQDRLEETQQLVHLGSWVWNLEDDTVAWSEEIYRILGRTPSAGIEPYGTFQDHLHPDDRVAVSQQLDLVREGEVGTHSFRLDCRVLREDGEIRWAQVTGAKRRTPDGRVVAQGTLMDVSERKRTEDAMHQAQKLESLGVLTGGIAHDFNNLLSALIGYLDIARMELPPDIRAQDYLAKAQTITTKAGQFTRQMLAYSGKGRFEVKPLDINQMVHEMGHLLSISISKMTALRYELRESLPTIQADTSQLQQVVMNLVINASEALEGGTGHVVLRTGLEYLEAEDLKVIFAGQEMVPGEFVVLEVEDNGHGMSQETLSRIFDPFFTTKFHGRGLGLAAMLGIVKGHHGGIKVYSEPGKGTRFKLFFPSSNELPMETDSGVFQAAYQGSGLVLVIDDEEDVRTTLCLKLQRMGFEVITAVDGSDGLQQFEAYRDQLRLVVTDLTMPHMDGAACFEAMHALDPSVPVLMVSGFSEPEAVVNLTKLGLAGFLAKPVRFSQLMDMVRQILEPRTPDPSMVSKGDVP